MDRSIKNGTRLRKPPLPHDTDMSRAVRREVRIAEIGSRARRCLEFDSPMLRCCRKGDNAPRSEGGERPGLAAA
jgi:hypothetical protein